MAKLNFGGVEENVVTREEFPLSKAQEVLKNETVAVIGYGVQGPGQALNQRDNGINVIVGQRKNSRSWDKAVKDGFVPGQTLFEIEEALEKGTIICYLLSDAAQIQLWPTVKKYLTPGKALYFSRATIPHDRDRTHPKYFKHLGIYAYRKPALDRFVSLPESSLERAERLEQLRFLENGISIYAAETPFDSIGVDTEDDFQRVQGLLK